MLKFVNDDYLYWIHLGDNAHQSYDFVRAQSYFEDAVAEGRRLLALRPGDEAVKRGLATALTRLGDVLKEREQGEEADQCYAEARVYG